MNPRRLVRLFVAWLVCGGAAAVPAGEGVPAGRALVAREGVEFRAGARRFATLTFGTFSRNWQGVAARPRDAAPAKAGDLRLALAAASANGVNMAVDVAFEAARRGEGDGLAVRARFTADADGEFEAVYANLSVPYAFVAGREVAVLGGGTRRTVAPDRPDRPQVAADGAAREASLALGGVGALRIDRAAGPGPVLMQDGRHWGGRNLDVRMQPAGPAAWQKGESRELVFVVELSGGIAVVQDQPVTIAEGPEWVALHEPTLDLAEGSAIDFSAWPARHAPAGKFGRVVLKDGRFVFADDPAAAPRRFYGVNFCFSSQYLDGDAPARLAKRLARMGYNTIRLHHYEGGLVNQPDSPPDDSTVPGAKAMDQFDRFFAAMKAEGLYVTTDLFVSRPVGMREVWPDAPEGGRVKMDDFKMAVPVNERAYANWCAFAKALLTHRNPYTGLTWGEDPALAWLSMINEGNFGNFIGRIAPNPRLAADWQRAYEVWCEDQFWEEAPPKAMPTKWNDLTRDAEILRRFLSDLEVGMFAKMKKFLREELRCEALLTNANAWSYDGLSPITRAEYDYVDDHFYVDHPEFLETPWQLPSRCPNESTVARGAIGGTGALALRLAGKPLTISEYNYSGPGRYRGVGGLLTGAMAARQDWDVLWRFAYSHGADSLFTPSRMHYFDIVSDPLNQVAERAALCLFLRGDLPPAGPEIRVVGDEAAFHAVNAESGARGGAFDAFALGARIVTERVTDPDAAAPAAGADDGPVVLSPAEARRGDVGARLLDALRRRGWATPPERDQDAVRIGDPDRDPVALRLDPAEDVLVFSTPRTAGGYAPPETPVRAGAVTLAFSGTSATAWVSSVDGDRPVAEARRLIACHLTDLQNTGARYADSDRRTLLDWGRMPWLALDGAVAVTLKRAPGAPKLRAWALALSGERREEIPVAAAADGTLTLTLSVRGEKGARLLYELAAE